MKEKMMIILVFAIVFMVITPINAISVSMGTESGGNSYSESMSFDLAEDSKLDVASSLTENKGSFSSIRKTGTGNISIKAGDADFVGNLDVDLNTAKDVISGNVQVDGVGNIPITSTSDGGGYIEFASPSGTWQTGATWGNWQGTPVNIARRSQIIIDKDYVSLFGSTRPEYLAYPILTAQREINAATDNIDPFAADYVKVYTNPTVDVNPLCPTDGANTVSIAPMTAGLGMTIVTVKDRKIVDADMVFSSKYRWSIMDPVPGLYNMLTVSRHENMHAIGFGHVPTGSNSVMVQELYPGESIQLSEWDKAGLKAIY